MPQSPTLLCLFPLGSELRQFGHSGLFSRLLDSGWHVTVAAKVPDDDLKSQLDSRVQVTDLPLAGVGFGLGQLISILDKSHAERERRLGSSGWQYGRVAGRNWKQRALYASHRFWGKSLSFSAAAHALASRCEAVAIRRLPSSPCVEFLRSTAPSVILLNVPRVDALLPLLSASQAHRIPALILYHTWKDVVAQGRLNFPFSHLGVWNDKMRTALLRQNPRVSPENVSMTGCSHFQCVGRQDLLLPETEFRRTIGAQPDSKLILFPASAPWLVPEEERYIRLLKNGLASLKSAGGVQIVVRLNPMDGDGRLADVLNADSPEVLVMKPDWRWDRQRNWCFQRRHDQVLYNSLLHYASACVGIPSTVTVECAVADVPVINIGFDLPGTVVQPGAVQKFWDADFYEDVRQSGAAKLAQTPGKFMAAVEEGLTNPDLGRESRKLLVKRQLGIAPHEAVEAAVRVLMETVKTTSCRSSP